MDFVHLGVLDEDGVFWVTRSKEALTFRVIKKLPKAADKRILRDQLVVLKNKHSRATSATAGAGSGGGRRPGARDGIFD